MALTWTALASPPAGGVHSLIYAAALSLWVGVGAGGIHTSPDGEIWTARTNPMGGELFDVVFVNLGGFPSGGTNTLVAVGENGIIYSTDGITWTEQTSAPAGPYFLVLPNKLSGVANIIAYRPGALGTGSPTAGEADPSGGPSSWNNIGSVTSPGRELITAVNDGNFGSFVGYYLIDPAGAGELEIVFYGGISESCSVSNGTPLLDALITHGDGGSSLGFGNAHFVLPDGGGVSYKTGIADWANVDFSSPVGSIAAAARYGDGKWVVTFGQTAGPGTGAAAVSMSSDDLTSWSEDTMPASQPWCPAAWDGTRFITLSRSGGAGAVSSDGPPPVPSAFWTNHVNTYEVV